MKESIPPIRIQRSRQHKQISSNGLSIKYCGRPSKWGNPFIVGSHLNAWGLAFIAASMSENPKQILLTLRSGLLKEPISVENSLKWYGIWLDYMTEEFKLDLKELEGFNLSCWCKTSDPCHVDILLERLKIQL